MDNQKELSTMTVKELRVFGKQNKVKKYYNITKEGLILALQNKRPEPQPADGKKSFFKKQTTRTTKQKQLKRNRKNKQKQPSQNK